MDRDYYIQLRNQYHPKKPNLIFLLESPHVSGKYFYDESGKTSEPLYRAMMKLLDYKPTDKKDGLEFINGKGYLLVDATYKPVNRLMGKERDVTILSDFNNLVIDLDELCLNRDTPINLVKANICKILDARLTKRGFNIINKGAVIPFPSHGQQKRFHSIALELLCGLNT